MFLTALHGRADGGWIFVGSTLTSAMSVPGDRGRDRAVVARFTAAGEYVGVVAETLGMERYVHPHRPGVMGGSGPTPLSPRARYALHGDLIYVAETLTPVIRVFDVGGTSVREIRWDVPAGPSADETFATVVDAVLDTVTDTPSGVVEERLLAGAPAAIPVFWDFMVDDLGFIWIQDFDPSHHAAARGADVGVRRPQGDGPWRVLDPDGVEVGVVDVPAGLGLYQITADAGVGIHRDELGVETVRVHRLVRR
jgi:hypothetical protein